MRVCEGVFDDAGAGETAVWLLAQAESEGATQGVENKMVSVVLGQDDKCKVGGLVLCAL